MKYKVGDRVRIKSIDWYNENKDDNHEIKFENGIFTTLKSTFLGQIMTIEEITLEKQYILMEDKYKTLWTDEMIEGLVEEATEPELKFKVGDKVITDTNMKGKIIEVVEEGWYRVEFEPHNGIPQPNGVIPEESMSLVEEEIKPKFKVGDILFYRGETSGYLKVEEIREENGEIRYYETSRNLYLIENDPDVFADKICSVEIEKTKSEDGLLDEYEELTDRAFKGGYEKCKSDIELNGFQLPEGYIFKDENGNVINATKIVLEKKKKKYPKTYEECLEVLGFDITRKVKDAPIFDYDDDIIALQRLKRCRDAYWKIAGEEMGLGKPWKPDWTNYNDYKFVIGVFENKIIKCYNTLAQYVLAFPTEEMRDAFYENFKEEIEICKELL